MASNQNHNSSTITGDVKSRIDKIWDTLWAGGMCLSASMPSKHSLPPSSRSLSRNTYKQNYNHGKDNSSR